MEYVSPNPDLDASLNKLIEIISPVISQEAGMDIYREFGLSVVSKQCLETISHDHTLLASSSQSHIAQEKLPIHISSGSPPPIIRSSILINTW